MEGEKLNILMKEKELEILKLDQELEAVEIEKSKYSIKIDCDLVEEYAATKSAKLSNIEKRQSIINEDSTIKSYNLTIRKLKYDIEVCKIEWKFLYRQFKLLFVNEEDTDVSTKHFI